MRTPLYETHRRLGARFVSFAGWDMPVQYVGIIEEHHAVRRRAGLFDVSHMGEVEVAGERAAEVLEELTTNAVSRLRDGQAQYSLLCLPTGGVVDDVTVHRRSDRGYLLCVNASNSEKDFEWIRSRAGGRASVVDRSAEYGQLALQGPAATEVLARCCRAELAGIRPFWFVDGEVGGVPAMIARTGYTGEDGWEIYCASGAAVQVWDALVEAGAGSGLMPAGLGARDTLRLERALPLYGHELTEETTPLEAGLDRFVRLDKKFIGSEALERQRSEGVRRKLVGLVLREAGVPRQGYTIYSGGVAVGAITSGTASPTLGKGIGLGYVGSAVASVGTEVEVEIRTRRVPAEIVALPFYRRR